MEERFWILLISPIAELVKAANSDGGYPDSDDDSGFRTFSLDDLRFFAEDDEDEEKHRNGQKGTHHFPRRGSATSVFMKKRSLLSFLWILICSKGS